MVAFVVPNFQGMAPRFADRLLSPSQASFAANLKATNGDLRGFRSLQPYATFPAGSALRRVVKLYYPGENRFVWFTSTDLESDVIQNPLGNDAFNRVYFTDATYDELQVTTLDNIANSKSSIPAGIPRPVVAPVVAGSAGGTPKTRAYCYVYISQYGAEGAPSPPTLETYDGGAAWTISGFQTPPSYVQFIDIYRSAAGQQSSGNYFKVGRIAAGVSLFSDTMADDLVPLQPELDTFDNDPPPDYLRGIVLHSSGALVGFKGRNVYFSRPYLLHAWPTTTIYPVDEEIVGLAAIYNFVVVLTKGTPTVFAGSAPTNMAPRRIANPEPCLAKRSIAVTNNTVYYASPNGICSVSADGVDRPTNPLMTAEEWAEYQPDRIIAGIYGSYYIGFYDQSRGFAFSLPPYEPSSFVLLDRYSNVVGVEEDSRTANLLLLQGDIASYFDVIPDARFATTWRSKEFIAEAPLNLGAVQVLFKRDANQDALKAVLSAMEEYNEDRFAQGALDVLDGYVVNGALVDTFATLPPILSGLPPIQPLGGEPLYNLTELSGTDRVRVTLIADGRVRYSKVISDEKTHKMPEGYKATRFYVELSGAAQVQRVVLAETARECRVA